MTDYTFYMWRADPDTGVLGALITGSVSDNDGFYSHNEPLIFTDSSGSQFSFGAISPFQKFSTGEFWFLQGTIEDPDTFVPTYYYLSPDPNALQAGTSEFTIYTQSQIDQSNDPVSLLCFLSGTLIATPDGEVAVEHLKPGDPVRTADGRVLPVRWVGRQTVHALFADPLRDLPIRIRAGALGNGLPRRDLLVSPGHAMGVGQVLSEAGALVNGTSILREPPQASPARFTWYHVELAEHALLLAEGAPAESFVDSAAPAHFDNHAERIALLGEDVPPIPEMNLPRAKSARQVPRALAKELARIAEELGCAVRQAA